MQVDRNRILDISEQVAPRVPVIENKKATAVIQLGARSFKKIDYNDMQAGDVICTYESVATIPTITKALSFQRAMSPSERKALYKMLHFEVILEKYPRTGLFKIAHASGLAKKVVIQNEDFKAYAPGQGLFVFRPVNKDMQKQIVEIGETIASSKTSHSWIIRLMQAKGIKQVSLLFNSFRFEKFSRGQADEKTLRKVARLAVDFESDKVFWNKNKTKQMSMSCVQYVANLINVSIVRRAFPGILNPANTMCRQKKIDTIVECLKEINASSASKMKDVQDISSFKYSDSAVSSASFVDFLFSHPDQFETVGYAGSICDQLNPSDKESVDFLSRKPASLDLINKLIDIELTSAQSKSQASMIVATLKKIGLLTTDGYLILSKLNDETKIKAAFAYLYAHTHQISLDQAVSLITKPKSLKDLVNFNDNLEEYKKFFIEKVELESPERENELENPELESPILKDIQRLFPSKKDDLIAELNRQGFLKSGSLTKKINDKALKNLFIKFYALEHDLNTQSLIDCADPKKLQAYTNIETQLNQFQKNMEGLTQACQSDETEEEYLAGNQLSKDFSRASLPHKQQASLLKIEASLLKALPYSIENSLKLSLNSLEQKKVEEASKRLSSRKLIITGIVCLILPPLGAILLAAGLFMRSRAIKNEKIYADWQGRARSIHQQERPNVLVELKTAGFDTNHHRPWIYYSLDGKKWDVEPLYEMGHENWQAKIKMEANMLYKFFIGPKDEKHTDPASNARWQKQQDNTEVKESGLRWNEKIKMWLAPRCDYPQFN